MLVLGTIFPGDTDVDTFASVCPELYLSIIPILLVFSSVAVENCQTVWDFLRERSARQYQIESGSGNAAGDDPSGKERL